jgi:uncharacterized protein
MLTILSPAKTLNFAPHTLTKKKTLPVFGDETEHLVTILQNLTATDLARLMDISPNLAALNYERYQSWKKSPTLPKQAILTFDGDVYDGLNAAELSEKQLVSAQKRVRILSGLYGVLRPLDLIRPHRLEMGTTLEVSGHKNLYELWKDKIVFEINKSLHESGSKTLVNLASKEYFKSIDLKKLDGNIVTADFKDLKNGTYKIISFYAKKARGLMARFIIENRITHPGDMKAFDLDGYRYAPTMSSKSHLIFVRDH